MDIDFVITWVDGSDLEWLKQKREYQVDQVAQMSPEEESKQFREWDTIRYWFRAVEKYAPWVRKIHFVTWGHFPDWLDTENPKLHIVNHDEFIPSEYLPVFNSNPIEINMHRIPDLAEHFVYFNDDFLLNAPVEPEDFFINGVPSDMGLEGGSGSPGDGSPYYHILMNCVALIDKNFSKREVIHKHLWKWLNPVYGFENIRTLCLLPWKQFAGFKNEHLTVAYLKSTFEKVWAAEPQALEATCRSRFRSPNDLTHFVMRYWQLCEGNFVPRRTIGQRLEMGRDSSDNVLAAINNKNNKVICFNDSSDLSEKDFPDARDWLKSVLERRFPEKSSFEY